MAICEKLLLYGTCYSISYCAVRIFVFLQGFPDYSPPQFVVDALVEAAKTPLLNQYTRSQVKLKYLFSVDMVYLTYLVHNELKQQLNNIVLFLASLTSLENE